MHNCLAGRHSFNDGIMGASGVLVGGKRELVCGYGGVGKDCGSWFGARLFIARMRPHLRPADAGPRH